jgi:hypothetical protein
VGVVYGTTVLCRGENLRARLANRFLFLFLKTISENENRKLFFVVFSLKKCLANCFQKQFLKI